MLLCWGRKFIKHMNYSCWPEQLWTMRSVCSGRLLGFCARFNVKSWTRFMRWFNLLKRPNNSPKRRQMLWDKQIQWGIMLELSPMDCSCFRQHLMASESHWIINKNIKLKCFHVVGGGSSACFDALSQSSSSIYNKLNETIRKWSRHRGKQ